MTIKEFLKVLDYLSDNSIILNVNINNSGTYENDYGYFVIGEKSFWENIKGITVKELREYIDSKIGTKLYKDEGYLIDENTSLKYGDTEDANGIKGLIITDEGIKIKEERILYY